VVKAETAREETVAIGVLEDVRAREPTGDQPARQHVRPQREVGPRVGDHGGLPVEPLEAWMRTISRDGAASRPNGYCSRRSFLVVNGRRARSSIDPRSSGETSASRRRWNSAPDAWSRATQD